MDPKRRPNNCKYWCNQHRSVLSRVSHVQLFGTLWTVAHQDPQSMELSRQEYWSGLPFSSPGDLPNLGIKPGLLHCRLIPTAWSLYLHKRGKFAFQFPESLSAMESLRVFGSFILQIITARLCGTESLLSIQQTVADKTILHKTVFPSLCLKSRIFS